MPTPLLTTSAPVVVEVDDTSPTTRAVIKVALVLNCIESLNCVGALITKEPVPIV
jgi:hypothetical protein